MENQQRQELAEAVYQVVLTIPKGRATSYGAIARAIGRSNLSRLVGKIMGECDTQKVKIPAHRVVNSQGILSARFCFEDPEQMSRLLEEEGVVVKNNRICNWKRVFWDPLQEINIDF